VDWVADKPRERSYRYLKSMLQYLQWQDGGRQGRPWVLKGPTHLGSLDILAETFPRAVIVHCHRDLSVGMASLFRLVEVTRLSRGTRTVDPIELGAYMLRYWAAEWERNLAARRALPDTVRVMDVNFADIAGDPMPLITSIYQDRGLTLTAEARTAMQNWEQTHPPGDHRYALADYGITRGDIASAFSRYLAHFPTYL
jgi:hypothetical protein